jgi:hypothetical protein
MRGRAFGRGFPFRQRPAHGRHLQDFFLNASGKMIGTDNLVADDDQSAIEAAKLSLASRDECDGFDIWLTTRLIHTEKTS